MVAAILKKKIIMYTFEKDTTEIKEGRLFAILWIVLISLFTIWIYLDRYEEPKEIKVPYIFTYKGYIENMQPHFIDEHCTNCL